METSCVKYVKSPNGGYHVKCLKRQVGFVKSSDMWTTRGNRKVWTAYRKGQSQGEFPSRKEAAIFLIEKYKDR